MHYCNLHVSCRSEAGHAGCATSIHWLVSIMYALMLVIQAVIEG